MMPFRPLLAGATLRDRAIACVGALFGIGLTGLVSRMILGAETPLALLLAAPMGASAVLLFAVPASPLAQPWPIVGGNLIAALVGVAVAHVVPDPMIASALAVAIAIAAMSMARCLHPPGGGTALVAALGGPVLASHGFGYALAPVAINAVLLVAAGLLFHRISGHSYPHRPVPPSQSPVVHHLTISEADIDAALQTFGEPLDIDREDLRTLANLAVGNAKGRT